MTSFSSEKDEEEMLWLDQTLSPYTAPCFSATIYFITHTYKLEGIFNSDSLSLPPAPPHTQLLAKSF